MLNLSKKCLKGHETPDLDLLSGVPSHPVFGEPKGISGSQ